MLKNGKEDYVVFCFSKNSVKPLRASHQVLCIACRGRRLNTRDLVLPVTACEFPRFCFTVQGIQKKKSVLPKKAFVVLSKCNSVLVNVYDNKNILHQINILIRKNIA
jgi:hypothetical protein